MAGRLSFSIAINLLTENFKRGANQVKAAFRSMQMQILTFAAALGAGGIGLSNLVSRFVDVARETNRVTTALKNVSGSMGQFADNQKYLLDLAKKYGLEINALTGNFAKFTAAASVSGMGMMEQRKIFESVSRACTAFSMSADNSNGVFLALSQMMSKGKISSEELRLQMGERLPIALQAMAKAAGVSVGGLDKLMKQGKLMSADVLPKFAEALNEMIPNVDTDNLETSANRLKNVFTELVNGSDAQSKYKALIDWLTGAIQGLGENLKNIMTIVFAAIAFIAVNAGTKIVKGWNASYNQIIAGAERANVASLRATERRVIAEGALLVKQNAEKLAIANYEATLADGTAKEVIAAEIAKDRAIKARVLAQGNLIRAQKSEQIALDKAATISAQTSAMQSATGLKKACNIMTLQASKLMLSLKAMWNSFAPAIIISAVVALWSYYTNLREEAERVKNIFSDYKKESESITHSPEIIQLEVLQDLYNKAAEGSELKEKYQNRIISLLGGELKKNQDINNAVRERIKLLEATANVDFFTRRKIESEEKLKELYDKRGGEDAFNFQSQNAYNSRGWFDFMGGDPIREEMEEAVKLRKIIADAGANIYKYSEYVEKNKPTTSPIDDTASDTKKTKKTELQKQQESYNKQFEELGAELGIGKITQAEYNKALGELNIKMFAEAKGTNDKKVLESEYYKNLKTAAEKAIKDQDENAALVEFEKVQKDYNDKVKENEALQGKGLISQKQLNENIASLSLEAAKSAAGIKGIGDGADGFITAMRINTLMLSKKPEKQKYDATFDYKKTAPEILGDKLDIAKKWRDDAKEQAKALGVEMTQELNKALSEVNTLESALKIAQVKEDIKDFSKELNESIYSGIKDIASSADRMVSAFKNLSEVMSDVDATGWERIMAVWNAMTNAIDSFMSIIKMIENLTEVTKKLAGAKDEKDSLEKGVAKTAIETGVQIAANQAAAEIELQTSQKKTAAATTEMAAKSTAAYANIPFAGMALAGAQIAAMTGMINGAYANVPKFANGGIVSGRTLAEVGEYPGASSNPEVIAPLSKLKSLIGDNGSNVIKTETKMTIRGSDMRLLLTNYMKKTGKGVR